MPEKNVQVNTDRGLPYERFLQFGPENLTEAELLAVILRTGTKEDSAVALAEKVLALATYPREGLLGLHDVSVEELMEIRGIGMVKAVKLKCIAELSNRMSRAKAREGICFTRADHVAEYFMEKLRHRDTECVYLLCLDDGRIGLHPIVGDDILLSELGHVDLGGVAEPFRYRRTVGKELHCLLLGVRRNARKRQRHCHCESEFHNCCLLVVD